MFKSYKFYTAIAVIFLLSLFILFQTYNKKDNSIPLIAIANYGPHASLQDTITGMKTELIKLGYIENENIRYEEADVNFETSLIIQMLHKLKSTKPDILVVLSTPIAQTAKNMFKNTPVVFADVTDPDSAGLLSNDPNSNVTGASDKQSLVHMLQFAKKLLPKAKSVGVLYSTGEANDVSMALALKEAALPMGIEVVAIPVEHTRDVVTRIRLFKDVDFIYTGSSGAIQAAIPAIVNIAELMELPLFNFNSEEVINHNVLASFGVSYRQVGTNTAHIVHRILQGEKPHNIKITYPDSGADYQGFVSRRRAKRINLEIPEGLTGITIVD